MSPPVYPNPLGPLDIETANYVNSMVDGIEANRAYAMGLDGHIAFGPGEIFCTQGVSSSVALVHIGSFQVWLDGEVRVYQNLDILTPTLTITGFSSNGFRYVYCRLDGTDLVFGSTETAPGPDGVWIDGEDGTWRYLFTVCRSSGVIHSATKSQGRYQYDPTDSTVVLTSVGHADRTVSLSDLIPTAYTFYPGAAERARLPQLYVTAELPSADTTSRPIGVGGSSLAYCGVRADFYVGWSGLASLGYFQAREDNVLVLNILDPNGAGGLSIDSTVTIYVRGWDEPWNP